MRNLISKITLFAIIITLTSSCMVMHDHGMRNSDHSTNLQEVDPVSGVSLNPDSSTTHYYYNGITYYFESQESLNEFKVRPDFYSKKRVDASKSRRRSMNSTYIIGGGILMSVMMIFMLSGGLH